jgi:1,4-alpha-glucan branching enzyme
VLPFSHDEVVHGKNTLLHKMPGDMWQQFANLRLLFAYQYAHPGKKLLFMGQEFGQRDEWYEARGLDWHLLQYESHRGVQRLVGDLNKLLAAESALHQVDFEWQGFEWIDANDSDNSVYSFIRRGKNPDDVIIVVLNATPVVRYGYHIGVPRPGHYEEVFNSDAAGYGGSNVGNLGGMNATEQRRQGRRYSLALPPPLAAVFLKWRPLDFTCSHHFFSYNPTPCGKIIWTGRDRLSIREVQLVAPSDPSLYPRRRGSAAWLVAESCCLHPGTRSATGRAASFQTKVTA